MRFFFFCFFWVYQKELLQLTDNAKCLWLKQNYESYMAHFRVIFVLLAVEFWTKQVPTWEDDTRIRRCHVAVYGRPEETCRLARTSWQQYSNGTSLETSSHVRFFTPHGILLTRTCLANFFLIYCSTFSSFNKSEKVKARRIELFGALRPHWGSAPWMQEFSGSETQESKL